MELKIKLSSDRFTYDEDGDTYRVPGEIEECIVDVVASKIADGIKDDVSEVVIDRLSKRIQASVDKLVSEVATSRLQETNRYGEPTGKSKTLVEAMEDAASKWWGQRVDYKGDPAHGYGDKKTRAEFYVEKAADQACSKVMNAFLDDAKEKLRAQLLKNVEAALEKKVGA